MDKEPTEKQLKFISDIERVGIAKCEDKRTRFSCWKFINDNKEKYYGYLNDINDYSDPMEWDAPLSQWGNE